MKRFQGIRLIIFDLDGTLVNAYPAIAASFNHVMTTLGYRRQESRLIRRRVGWGDEELLKPFVRTQDLARALALYRRHHRRALLRGARLFPGVKRLLRQLKEEGYKLAVASNRPTIFSRILMRHLGVDRYFDYTLCADKLSRGKPDPEILRRIMRKFRLSPDEVIYVGDMVIDIQAGRRAGARTVAITGGSSSSKDIRKERPELLLNDIRQLRRAL